MLSVKEKLRVLDRTSLATPLGESFVKGNVEQAGLQTCTNELGDILIREKRYPLHFQHGQVTLDKILNLTHKDFRYINKSDFGHPLEPKELVFFDSETTGLAGGSGTCAFLCGFGFIESQEFIVRQYLLADYKHEQAYLSEINNLLKKFQGLVSFNGKSYDVPLLRTRFIINRLPFDIDHLAHLDLLHAARRLWKKSLNECNLGNIENRILGFARHNDIPGERIPKLFFDFVKTNDVNLLIPVFKHNVIDILSMVSILIKMAESFQLDFWMQDEKRIDKRGLFQSFALFNDENALEFLLNKSFEENNTDLIFEIALYYKKANKIERAVHLWEILLTQPNFYEKAYIELAKYYEHYLLSYKKAFDIVQRALKRIETRTELGRSNEVQGSENWHHRKKRLIGKMTNIR